MPKEKVKKKVEAEETEVEETEVEETEEEETEEVAEVKKKAVKAAEKVGVPKRTAVRLVEEVQDPDPEDRESILAYLKKVEKKIDRFLKASEPEPKPDEKLPPGAPQPEVHKEKSFSEWWDSL